MEIPLVFVMFAAAMAVKFPAVLTFVLRAIDCPYKRMEPELFCRVPLLTERAPAAYALEARVIIPEPAVPVVLKSLPDVIEPSVPKVRLKPVVNDGSEFKMLIDPPVPDPPVVLT